MGKYIHARRVLQETTGCYRFTTGSYNSLNHQANQIQIGWDTFFYLLGCIRSPFQMESLKNKYVNPCQKIT